MTVSVGTRLGRYQVVSELGSGGWATVYAARVADGLGEDRWVALKVLHPHLSRSPENVAAFLEDARVAGRLRHPHVVATLDAGASRDGRYFLVLDLVPGASLAVLRDRAGPGLTAAIALRIVLDVLDALAFVHDAVDEWGRALGLVHGDLAPRNILLGTDGLARISDLGLAGRLPLTPAPQRGAQSYLAPEQVAGLAVDRRSDLFGVGALLWELLTGQVLPRRGRDRGSVLEALSSVYPLLSSVRPELAAFDATVARCLSPAPEERFESAAAVARALEADASGTGIADRPALAALVQASQRGLATDTEVARVAPTSAAATEPSAGSTSSLFVGRGADVDRVAAWLVAGARAIALVGMGGVGKTRLMRALEGSSQRSSPLLSTAWIDLFDVSGPSGIRDHIAAAFGAPDERALGPLLAARGALVLFLDNADGIAAELPAFLMALLEAAPQLQVVLTSRVVIELADLHVHEVSPLAVPAADADYQSSAAGELLHGLMLRRGIHIDDGAMLGAILRKVGGIPLAIELVAGRLDALTPREVLGRLDHQLALLTRPGAPGHRWSTMEACIEWSWAGLSPYEREALGQWAIFDGPFRASWAERTIQLDAWENAPSALDVLSALRSKSLVQRTVRPGGELWLEIAPPVRELAIDRLARRGDHERARRRHVAGFVALAQESWHQAIDAASAEHTSLAAASHELVTALVRAHDGSVELSALEEAQLWAALGATIEHLREGHRLVSILEAAVARVSERDEEAIAMGLSAIARIASAFQKAPLALAAAERARAIPASLRTRAEVARAFAYTLGTAGRDGEVLEATLKDALEEVRAGGDPPSEARLRCDLADLARWRLDARASIALFEDVLSVLDPDGAMLGDAPRVSSMLAEALLATGQTERAKELIVRVLGAPHLPPTLAVVTRARAAVLHILRDEPAQALATARGCIRDPSAFPVVLRRAHMYAALACVAGGAPGDAKDHLRYGAQGTPVHERVLVDAVGVLCMTAQGEHERAAEAAASSRASLAGGIRPAARLAAESALDIALLTARPEPPRHLLGTLESILNRPLGDHGSAGEHMLVRAMAHVTRAALLERDRLDTGPKAPEGTLLLARGGEWLVSPEGTWVDSARRPMLGRLVVVLAREQGRWLTVPELLAALWPGDRSSDATLRNRLHALVSGAKKLGLQDHLESRRGAYRLLDSLPVAFWDTPPKGGSSPPRDA
jgi:serine/threonine-protein kinase